VLNIPTDTHQQQRALRVLHLPTNTASIPSHTVRAQRTIGIDAKAVQYTWSGPATNTDMTGVELVMLPESYRSLEGLRCIADFARRVQWADVIHWYFSTRLLPRRLDFRIVRALRRPSFVEWMGSDIRDPEVEIRDNPVFRTCLEQGHIEGIWASERSREVQRDFYDAGFRPLAAPGMLQYVLSEYTSRMHVVERGLVLSDYVPLNRRTSGRPLIVSHAPSDPRIKGTEAVVRAIESLRGTIDFEFDLIQGVSRREAILRMGQSDVFVDQLVLGDYGMASIEAMALGIPVICYVKPSLSRAYGGPPVENATPDDVAEAIRRLLLDDRRRMELSSSGLRYVRARHDAVRRGEALLSIYRDALTESSSGPRHL
jgi:hypothetical protein